MRRNCMNQCEKLLDYMKANGSITGMESIGIGVMNYKGRIHDIRKIGVNVEKKMETHVNESGEKKTFARYYLV